MTLLPAATNSRGSKRVISSEAARFWKNWAAPAGPEYFPDAGMPVPGEIQVALPATWFRMNAMSPRPKAENRAWTSSVGVFMLFFTEERTGWIYDFARPARVGALRWLRHPM